VLVKRILTWTVQRQIDKPPRHARGRVQLPRRVLSMFAESRQQFVWFHDFKVQFPTQCPDDVRLDTRVGFDGATAAVPSRARPRISTRKRPRGKRCVRHERESRTWLTRWGSDAYSLSRSLQMGHRPPRNGHTVHARPREKPQRRRPHAMPPAGILAPLSTRLRVHLAHPSDLVGRTTQRASRSARPPADRLTCRAWRRLLMASEQG
jgi:hypothetical protein